MSQAEALTDQRFHSFSGTSFGGIAAAQYYVDFYIWEAVLNDLPDLEAIVEIGTLKGGFSRYLSAQAQIRGLIFRTYDVLVPERKIPGFIQMDVFANSGEIGEWLRSQEPFILLCDGGNKPRELRTFSTYMGLESVIAAHDWDNECKAEDVPDWLEMVYGDFCERFGSATRFFRRKDE